MVDDSFICTVDDIPIDISVNVELPNAATGSTFPRVLGCQLHKMSVTAPKVTNLVPLKLTEIVN